MKAIIHVIGNDIQFSAGALQMCAGRDAGSEVAIHALRAIFEDNNTHVTLFVNATNTLNLVNRQAALHNISVLCQSFYIHHLKKHLWCIC